MGDDLKAIHKTLEELKEEIKENRYEIVKLKQELSTGKGAIKAIAFVGVIVSIIWTTLNIIAYK